MILDDKIQSQETEEQSSFEMKEAARIEEETYLKTKEARMQLDRALAIQNSTLNELEKQGEAISQIKDTALNVYENSKASCEMEFRINEESRILPSFGSFINKMKRWWNKDRKMEKEVNEIKNKKNNDFKPENASDNLITKNPNTEFNNESSPVQESKSALKIDNSDACTEEEFVPGESKTDGELTEILKTLKKLNSGTKTQIKTIKKQKGDLEDISKLEGFSTKIVDETEKHIQKNR